MPYDARIELTLFQNKIVLSGAPRDWSLDLHEDGRSGKVFYREAAGSLSFYWEFGGGDTVASSRVGNEAEWRKQTTWVVTRRAEILQRIASEVIRRKAPSCHAQLDELHGWVHLKQGNQSGTAPPPLLNPQQQHLRVSEAKGKIMFIAAIILVVLVAISGGAQKFLSVRVARGVPIGDSVRAGNESATLIETLEPYIPSLNHKPSTERFQLKLLLYPGEGQSSGRITPLAKNLTAQEPHWAKLLGGDERTVWCRLSDIGGVEVATGRRIGPAELHAANPTLAEAWDDPRRIAFDRRLQISLLDRSVLEIDPQTLKASPAPKERKSSPLSLTITAQDFLCADVLLSPTEWLGLHSPQEAQRDYKPKSSLTCTADQSYTTERRRFYGGQIELQPEYNRREIISMTPLSSDDFLNAGFVRSGLNEEALRLTTPEGSLMVFTSESGRSGTLVVARVNMDGKLAWQVDTGIDRFKCTQVLPAAQFVAFLGPRPSVPNKLSEPILVIINTQPGTQTTRTLWK